MRSHKYRNNYHKSYLAFKKGKFDFGKYYKLGRKYGRVLESGYYDTQTWGALHKCWIVYVIGKNKGEQDKMLLYARLIQKFEKELGIEVSDFPQLGLFASDRKSILNEEEGE